MNKMLMCISIEVDENNQQVKLTGSWQEIHPELPKAVTNEYLLCNWMNRPSKTVLVVSTDFDGGDSPVLLETTAQILQEKNGRHMYLLVTSFGKVGYRPEFHLRSFDCRHEAKREYQRTFERFNNRSFISLTDWFKKYEPDCIVFGIFPIPRIFQWASFTQVLSCSKWTKDMEEPQWSYYKTSVQGYGAGRDTGETLNSTVKKFYQTFMFDWNFKQSATMRAKRFDIRKTALGYPSSDAIRTAYTIALCLGVDSYLQRVMSSNCKKVLLQLLDLLIPASNGQALSCEFDGTNVGETIQILLAMNSEKYRERLLLPYAQRVNLFLSSLKYPITPVDQGSPLAQAITRCIANTGRGLNGGEAPYTVTGVYHFDSGAPHERLRGDKRLLLWHGTKCYNICGLLQNGFRKTESQATKNVW